MSNSEKEIMPGVFLTKAAKGADVFAVKVDQALRLMMPDHQLEYLKNMISTIQNSREKLQESQKELHDALETSPNDVDFKVAIVENNGVLARMETQLAYLKTLTAKLEASMCGGKPVQPPELPNDADTQAGLYL